MTFSGVSSGKMGFPDGSAGKESACNAGDTRNTSLIPGLGRSPGGGNGNPYCCRKGEAPLQGLRSGPCLTLGKELSEQTRADKAGDFLGKGQPGGERRGREPRRTALPHGS